MDKIRKIKNWVTLKKRLSKLHKFFQAKKSYFQFHEFQNFFYLFHLVFYFILFTNLFFFIFFFSFLNDFYQFQRREQTMERINPQLGECQLGSKDKLSKLDIYRINRLYNCPNTRNRFDKTNNRKGEITSKEECVDTSKLCFLWASAGDCILQSEGMKNICPFTCKMC